VYLASQEWHRLQWSGGIPQVAIKEKIKEEYESWRRAKLFRGTGFGFPDPSVTLWQLGE
jgi:hypothetical protein